MQECFHCEIIRAWLSYTQGVLSGRERERSATHKCLFMYHTLSQCYSDADNKDTCTVDKFYYHQSLKVLSNSGYAEDLAATASELILEWG